MIMKLFVIGATGRTGREIVEQALARGHDVTAFVRSLESTSQRNERLTIVRGNAMEENELRDAMQDHGAVVSTSGSRKVFKPSSMLRIGSVFGNAARFIYYPSWLRVTCSAN
jgi:putative NADH-flavin reductase